MAAGRVGDGEDGASHGAPSFAAGGALMDPNLAVMCTSTVLVEPQTTSGQQGTPGYGAAVSFSARIENKTEYRTLPNGDVVATKGRVYMVPNGATVPRVGIDRITLPSTEPVTQPPTVDVTTEVDENGDLDHIVVYF